jgi:hypothetical protein
VTDVLNYVGWKVAGPVVSRRASTPEENTADTDLRRTGQFLFGVTVVGLIALLVWAFTLPTWAAAFASLGLGALIAGTAALVGGILGLLFGIPKSIADPAAVLNPPPAEAAGGSPLPDRARYAANSNLEQVSDWLTKIIVGVGLTQIPTLRDYFAGIAAFFAGAFPSAQVDPTTAQVAAGVLVIYGLTAGFLAGYLLTRMFLPGAFNRAEEELKRQTRELQKTIEEREQISTEVRQAEGEIFADLYDYAHQGFRRAIEKANSLLAWPGQETNPRLWVYLASAQGQAYRWEQEHRAQDDPARDAILKEHRDAALKAVQNAIGYGPSWKRVLQLSWDPTFPGKPEEENDLEVFHNDEEFRRLLG